MRGSIFFLVFVAFFSGGWIVYPLFAEEVPLSQEATMQTRLGSELSIPQVFHSRSHGGRSRRLLPSRVVVRRHPRSVSQSVWGAQAGPDASRFGLRYRRLRGTPTSFTPKRAKGKSFVGVQSHLSSMQ